MVISKKICVIFCLLTIAIHIALYVIISINGSYGESSTGKIKYQFGMSVMDRQQWDPYGTRLRITDTAYLSFNLVSLLFLPNIVIDRFLWHKDINYAIDLKLGDEQ